MNKVATLSELEQDTLALAKHCPGCFRALNIQARGDEYFAWCNGRGGVDGDWGCKGVSAFGPTTGAAASACHDAYWMEEL